MVPLGQLAAYLLDLCLAIAGIFNMGNILVAKDARQWLRLALSVVMLVCCISGIVVLMPFIVTGRFTIVGSISSLGTLLFFVGMFLVVGLLYDRRRKVPHPTSE